MEYVVFLKVYSTYLSLPDRAVIVRGSDDYWSREIVHPRLVGGASRSSVPPFHHLSHGDDDDNHDEEDGSPDDVAPVRTHPHSRHRRRPPRQQRKEISSPRLTTSDSSSRSSSSTTTQTTPNDTPRSPRVIRSQTDIPRHSDPPRSVSTTRRTGWHSARTDRPEAGYRCARGGKCERCGPGKDGRE